LYSPARGSFRWFSSVRPHKGLNPSFFAHVLTGTSLFHVPLSFRPSPSLAAFPSTRHFLIYPGNLGCPSVSFLPSRIGIFSGPLLAWNPVQENGSLPPAVRDPPSSPLLRFSTLLPRPSVRFLPVLLFSLRLRAFRDLASSPPCLGPWVQGFFYSPASVFFLSSSALFFVPRCFPFPNGFELVHFTETPGCVCSSPNSPVTGTQVVHPSTPFSFLLARPPPLIVFPTCLFPHFSPLSFPPSIPLFQPHGPLTTPPSPPTSSPRPIIFSPF